MMGQDKRLDVKLRTSLAKVEVVITHRGSRQIPWAIQIRNESLGSSQSHFLPEIVGSLTLVQD